MFPALKKQKLASRFGGFALEVFSVVFAVLLALVANDWRESRSTEELTQRSIASIKQELETNLILVQNAHEHHGKILDFIRKRLPTKGEPSKATADSILAELYKEGIIKPAAVVAIAWSTAQISGGIQGIDFDVVLSFSKVYAFQNDYQRATQATNNAMNIARFIGAESSSILAGIYESVNTHWWHEKRLIEAYNEAIKNITQTN
ncbi:MAG: hypothetical protein GF313_03780 [Caldithrix sp.]|nr:hypothetical protein [Caldithrix sp.]